MTTPEPPDPATDPSHDLRRYPQDDEARQPWESLVGYLRRLAVLIRTRYGDEP